MINNGPRDIGQCRSQLITTAVGGKRARSQIQNKIEYLPDAKIGTIFINIIPNEIWLHIFNITGNSDGKFIETCKSWQYIIENDYEIKNTDKNYLKWDSTQLARTLTPKMINVSNKIFYELIMRHRSLVLSAITRVKFPKEFERFDKICKVINEDSFSSKKDHVFKSVARLFIKHEYHSFKALQVVKNGQATLLNKIGNLISNEADNQNYKILYNYILGINPDRVRTVYAGFNEKYPFLNIIKNTDLLKELLNTKNKTAVQFRKIVELKEWPLRQDLKTAAFSTLKEGLNLIEAVGPFQKYSYNNYEMKCAEILEISPAFIKAEKFKELAQLCTHFAYLHSLYASLEDLRTLIDLCRQANQFVEAANLGLQILNNKKMHPSIDEQKKIAIDCFKASMFNDAANVIITKLNTSDEREMLIEALTKAERFAEVAQFNGI